MYSRAHPPLLFDGYGIANLGAPGICTRSTILTGRSWRWEGDVRREAQERVLQFDGDDLDFSSLSPLALAIDSQ